MSDIHFWKENWAVFVYNSVQEITQLSNKRSWRPNAGTQNPAVLASHGDSADVVFWSKLCVGPEWLMKSPFELAFSVTSTNHCWYCRYFSQYLKILCLLGWILRFLHNCQHLEDKKSGELVAIELSNAERHMVKFIQKESFNGVEDERITPLMEMNTKISECKDVLEFRHPAVLPADYPVVTGLVYGLHELGVFVSTMGEVLGTKRETNCSFNNKELYGMQKIQGVYQISKKPREDLGKRFCYLGQLVSTPGPRVGDQ
ncbi:hypothetical protein PR048_013352 [Dryococelus australis]|uniref:Uncharacterized protein n=1 Tax=Dryococelus australis TaxID=614101 RepID=A0ABQ9HSC9_9NEOP|nr:hypothetical protein PR048_013352 [Dryococelus australis]